MPLSIKVNLRVTGHCNQGGRKYMEDMFSVAYQQTSDDKDLEYAFFGIFDGHGGDEAAIFAKEHLMDIIVKQKNFWSDKDEDVLRAIRDGYVNTHYAMWRELDKWPRTASGLPSTAGTTASVAFIRKGKIYIGHVGDSGIVLGYQEEVDSQWKARPLTRDHKPESTSEMSRIQESGGKVVSKSGVPRVVWNRPRIGHKGPVRRSTHIDEIPFLAVARSLGDLWSYNSELDTFVVSPEPDVQVITIDVKTHRCLIFGTDGLWNMLTPQGAVNIVQAAERHNEKHFIASQQTGSGTDTQMWINPSKSLVDRALERWESTRLRADNTSVVTLMLDPPGPSRGEVLLSRKKQRLNSSKALPVTAPILSPTKMPTTPVVAVEKSALSPPILPVATPIADVPLTLETTPKPPHIVPQLTVPSSNGLNSTPEDSPAPVEPTTMPQSLSTPTKDSKIHQSVPKELKTPEKLLVIVSPGLGAVAETAKAPTATSKNIQVAEISSSDTPIEKSPLKSSQEPLAELFSSEKPDSPSKDLNVTIPIVPVTQKPTINAPHLQKMLLTTTAKTEPFKITRQNAFNSSCNELKSVPRLRRSQFNIQTCKEVTTRRRTHSTTIATVLDKHSTLLTARNELRSAKRRQSEPQILPAMSSVELKQGTEQKTPDCLRESSSTKRRHSSTTEEEAYGTQEPCSKRRTRSEDHRCPGDENAPANQEAKGQSSRVRWPGTCSKGRSSTPGTSKEEKSPGYQRRSLEKKATPVKTIRRPSINGSSRVLRGSFALREWDQAKATRRSSFSDKRRNSEVVSTPQMWLRSDTIAATPIKTLRSRNVDIQGHTVPPQVAHQYGIVKQKGISSKIKLGNAKKMKQTASISSSTPGPSGISKRVKSVSPYNPSARSLNTKSRLKRLGK